MLRTAEIKQNKTKGNRDVFESMPIWQALRTMCVPTIIAQMVVLVYNLAYTFFIGRTGNPYMVAATSLILPVFNVSIGMSSFLGVGGGTLISRLMGVKRDDEARKVCGFIVSLGILVSVLYALFIYTLADPLLRALGASDNTFTFARQYLLLVSVAGGVPTILSLTMSQLLRAVGCSKQAGFGISMGGILNMFLDPLFMFVLLPKGQEVIGAGIATMLSNVVSLLYFLRIVYGLQDKTVLTLSPRNGLPELKSIRSALVGGIPAATGNILFDFSQVMINKLMSGYGDIALAAMGIVLKAERIPLNIGGGIAQGMMPIVAFNYGARNLSRLHETVKKSRIAGLVMAAMAILFYELCADSILRIFIDNKETQTLGAAFLRARCLATPFMFMCFHILFAFQGMGKAGIAMLLAVVRQLVLYVPILVLMNHLFSRDGLVWAQLVSDILMVAFSFFVYNTFMKKEKSIAR